MKIRESFVSNSSSSSFIVQKKFLSQHQQDLIRNHYKVADGDNWDIRENEDMMSGSTRMDNFSMHEYMKEIGVDLKYVNWTDQWDFYETEDEENED